MERIVKEAGRGHCSRKDAEPRQGPGASQWAREGMDFAEALRLAASEGCDGILSFDRDLKRKAARAGP